MKHLSILCALLLLTDSLIAQQLIPQLVPVAGVSHSISVKEFGAACDSHADDTVPIQKAVTAAQAAGAILIFPPGTCNISSTIAATAGRYVYWVGAAPRSTILNWVGGASPMLLFNVATEPIVERITLDNHGAATVGILSNSLHSSFSHLHWIPAIAFSTAMIQSRTDDVVERWTFDDVYLGGFAGQRSPVGVLLNQGNSFTFRDCFFDDLPIGIQAGGPGIGGGSAGGIIQALVITGSEFQAAEVSAVTNAVGIDLYHVRGFSVEGNLFYYGYAAAPNQLAIKLRTAQGGLIAGNFLSGLGQANYMIEAANTNAANVDIQGNRTQSIVVALAHVTAGTQINVHNNMLSSTASEVVQTNLVFANLPSVPTEGMAIPVTDSNTATWGAAIAGGGSNHVLAYYDGTNWTVAAK